MSPDHLETPCLPEILVGSDLPLVIIADDSSTQIDSTSATLKKFLSDKARIWPYRFLTQNTAEPQPREGLYQYGEQTGFFRLIEQLTQMQPSRKIFVLLDENLGVPASSYDFSPLFGHKLLQNEILQNAIQKHPIRFYVHTQVDTQLKWTLHGSGVYLLPKINYGHEPPTSPGITQLLRDMFPP